MNDQYINPPPPYEQSLENDQKITDSLQQEEFSKKTPIQDDSRHAEWEQTKEYIALQNKALMDIPVRPLRIQKRPPPSNRGLRGPRPLPPCPVHPKLQSAQAAEAPRLKSILETKVREESAEEQLSPAPPPFTPVGSSLDGPPYRDVPSLSDAHHSLFDTSRHNRQLHTSYSETYNEPRRNGYSVIQEDMMSPNRTRARLAFDPSVAYSLNNQWNNTDDGRTADPAALYSSAVSPHVHRTPMTPGSRYPYTFNRAPAHSRPFSFANNEAIRAQDATSPISLQSSPSLPVSSTASLHSLVHSPPPAVARHSRVRWAASESDITVDIYRD